MKIILKILTFTLIKFILPSIFSPFLSDCKTSGYQLNLLHLWLESPEFALERVVTRVEDEGHDIPEKDVRMRYQRGLVNLLRLYMPLVDNRVTYDNSADSPELIARKKGRSAIMIANQEIWQMIN